MRYLARRLWRTAITACVGAFIGTVYPAFAVDYVLIDNSTTPSLIDNDTITITDYYGDDNNTNSRLIIVDVDNITIDVNGTLQGDDELLYSDANHDNLEMNISQSGEVVARGTRAIDIDGTNEITTTVNIKNSGIIYSAERLALSAQDIVNGAITNSATGTISASDRTIIFNDSDNVTFTNAGSVLANNDNLSYRDDSLTVSRVTSGDGYAVVATNAVNLTIENTGTISSNGRRTVYLKNTDALDFTNTGTIAGDGDETIQLEEATNAVISNSGTISGDSNVIYGDEFEDSSFTNEEDGTITATGDVAVYLQYADNASFVNEGTVTSSGGTVIDTTNALSATVTNRGTLSTTATGTDYIITGSNTNIINAEDATLSSTAEGLNLGANNEFRNYGTLTLDDNKTAVTITGNNNTIRLYDGSSMSGGIAAGASTTGNALIVDNDESFGLSDNITGSIALTKTGDGTLTISGTHSYTGDTTVSAGTFTMNATAASSDITIASGATLGGSGTTGDVTNNGTVAPGNSIGTLNVSGDVTLASSSTLQIEITGDDSSDQIIATGTMTNDGILRLIPRKEKAFGEVETYQIITAGSASGTFDTITIRACGADVATSYNATNVTVTVSGCYEKKGDALDQIENYVNTLYDQTPSADLSTVLTELEGLRGAEYEEALGTMDIDAPQAIIAATTQNLRTVNGFIAQRANVQAGGNANRQALRMLTSAEPLSAENKLTIKDRLADHADKGMWVKAYGGDGEKKPIKDLGVNGYDYDFQGTTIGFDLHSEGLKNGLALTLETGSVTSNQKQGYQEYETVMLNYQNTQFFEDGDSLALSAAFAATAVDNKRYIAIGAIDRTATSDYRTYTLDLAAGFTFAPMRLGPFSNDMTLSFGLNYNTRESYRETGAGALNLTVDPKHTAKAQFGLENTLYFDGGKQEGARFLPFVSAGLFASRHLTNTAVKQGFTGASKVTVLTDRDQEAFGEFGIGFVNIEEDEDELRFLGKAKLSDKVTEYSAALDYGIKF